MKNRKSMFLIYFILLFIIMAINFTKANTVIDLNNINANLSVYGDNATDELGGSVASGDINNDGFKDVIIGAFRADAPGGINAGEVYVIYGKNYGNSKIIDLDTVNANVTIRGNNAGDRMGSSVASGDINNDGIADIIIGADLADPPGGTNAGEVYVIYGKNYGTGKIIDLNAVNANITVRGDNADDQLGSSVASGDINNDGIADIIIGAGTADAPGGINAGEVYVIYGKNYGTGKIIDLNTTNANLSVYGDNAADELGGNVASGDINNDGFKDVIIGAFRADAPGGINAGEVYVIYGKNYGTGKIIDLNTTNANLSVYGDNAADELGGNVASGDINNDGFKDVIIGAFRADAPGGINAGEVYVIYGKNYGTGKIIDLNTVNANITVSGDNATDELGGSVASGDINNDGIADIIIGADLAYPPGGGAAGEVYVIYGKNYGTGKIIDLNTVNANITVSGDDIGDRMGSSVASGDINNDGIADIIIGALGAAPPGGVNAGEVYVIYGKNYGTGKIIDLNTVNANITVRGDNAGDQLGFSVASGGINNLSGSEIIIGARLADSSGGANAGAVYVIYGKSSISSISDRINPAGKPLPPQAQKPNPFNIRTPIQNLLSGFFFFIFRR